MEMAKNAWMVRAGRDNEIAAQTKKQKAVAIGWSKLGNLTAYQDRDAFRRAYQQAYSDQGDKRQQVNADQAYRFVREIRLGDYVLTYQKATRTLSIGTVDSEYIYDPTIFNSEYPHLRRVKWLKEVSRDDFSEAARASMGSTLTVFRLTTFMDEITRAIVGQTNAPLAAEPERQVGSEELEARQMSLIADKLAAVKSCDLEDLVAAVFRAMGYKAFKVGDCNTPDKGVDVMAYPDALQLSSSRINIQVKHTKELGRPEIQKFKGAIRDEKGILISLGGFSKPAKAEAETAKITLLDDEAFLDLMLEHYDNLPQEWKSEIPLRRIWVPID